MSERLIIIVLAGLVIFGGSYFASKALDKSFKNQDIMLCESAKKSGNLEWLERCEVYYKTNNAEDIQNEL